MPEDTVAKILIVDDEAAQTNALQEILRYYGYHTDGYCSATEALSALRRERYDLLLTDLMMPGMDGIQLLKEARKIDEELVGVLMTGAGTISTAVEAMKVGALDYILKPFELSVILPVLSRALSMHRLRLANSDLERRVRDRSIELEVANKELEAFSYSISHDLRAPLRTINSFTELLLNDFATALPEEAQQLHRKVIESVKKMELLVDDLLRFSRVGRNGLHKEHVDVSALARKILTDFNSEKERRAIEIVVGELPDCFADISLLRQVLVNLISNAFKYTSRKQHAKIELGCRSECNENIYFVRDNGAGFDMQYASKLFGVFQRLHSTSEFEGTGVGLSIAQRIILKHGGRIWAQGAIGEGATFSFTIPA